MSRPFPSRPSSPSSFIRVNGKIRAREVRVIGDAGQQMGVFTLAEAINMARTKGVDLVEIAANATPPVCRLVDFGKYRYEQSKKERESKKHQHANKVKEIQLSPSIDPHDFGVKFNRAVDFLCEEMKVKITLRFRGRELAHKEIGFQQIEKFLKDVAPFGHPDAPAKLIGKGINVMISPLPRNKRAKHPRQDDIDSGKHTIRDDPEDDVKDAEAESEAEGETAETAQTTASSSKQPVNNSSGDFSNRAYDKLDVSGNQATGL